MIEIWELLMKRDMYATVAFQPVNEYGEQGFIIDQLYAQMMGWA